jgi:hypothetical protein
MAGPVVLFFEIDRPLQPGSHSLCPEREASRDRVAAYRGITMEAPLSEAKMAVEAVKLVRSEHHSNITIQHYECAREGIGPDLEFGAIMGVALARAYGAPVSHLKF